MKDIRKLSIVLVTWNGDGILRNCLDSLKNVYDTQPEIIVVDNANTPSTAALVSDYPNARYIAAPENLGFAGGNNLIALLHSPKALFKALRQL